MCLLVPIFFSKPACPSVCVCLCKSVRVCLRPFHRSSARLSVRPSVCLSNILLLCRSSRSAARHRVRRNVGQSICQNDYIRYAFHRFIRQSLGQPVRPSVRPLLRSFALVFVIRCAIASFHHPSVRPSTRLSVNPSVRRSVIPLEYIQMRHGECQLTRRLFKQIRHHYDECEISS